MIKKRWLATTNGDRLNFQDREGLRQHVASFRDGSEVYVTISKKTKDRSTNQNAYYWGVVLKVISQETGHSAEELHEIFKTMFLPPKIITFKDKSFKMPSTTTQMSTMDFSDYIERIRAEVATMGITIPNPEQITF